MFNGIRLEKGKLVVEDKEYNLISGEVHYWRIPKESWCIVLDRVKELRLKIVSTYVPWNYHELEPGKYDFTGETSPQRDLDGFLSLCKKKGLLVLIRPGPYIYSEMPWAGVPEYAAKYHRMHPKFLEYAERWITAVAETVVRHQYPKGSIVLLQADNELDTWEHLYGDQLGLYGGDGLFQKWLREKYSRIEELNEAWGTKYTDFSEVKAWQTRPEPPINPYLKRYLDFCEFKEWYCTELASLFIKMYRDRGVHVPIYLNTYPWGHPQNFIEFRRVADLIGIDVYLRNMIPEEELVSFSLMLKYLKATVDIAWSAEFECGIWHDWHYGAGVLEPQHYRYMAFLGLMFGLVGWNWYMLVNRDNWYFSPINEWGRVRKDLYPTFKKIVEVYSKISPSDNKILSDLSIVVTRDHIWGIRSKWAKEFFSELHRNYLDFNVYEPLVDNIRGRLLLYIGSNYIKKHYLRNILKAVEEGSILLVFGEFPALDDSGEPLEEAKSFHVEPIASMGGGTYLLGIKKNSISFSTDKVLIYDPHEVKGEPLVIERIYEPKIDEEKVYSQLVSRKRTVAGYMVTHGAGKVIVLGVKPTVGLLEKIMELLDIPIYCRSQVPGVLSSIHMDEDKYLLFIANTVNKTLSTKIEINVHALNLEDKEELLLEDLTEGKTYKLTAKELSEKYCLLKGKDVKIMMFRRK
ncbi:MAG: beta-galactosidase [Thermoproteales archaeon]|nr:beta-galactosidase [Thermoproteales archaeon]